MLPYGIIGNCRTSALVKRDGSIDWLCFPTFASASVFARILDPKGGSCRIIPRGKHTIKQRYLPDTAILETTYTGSSWEFLVYDFFPRYRKLTKKKHAQLVLQNRLIRLIKPVKGKPRLKIIYEPRPDYAREECELIEEQGTHVCKGKKHDFVLITDLGKRALEGERFTLCRTTYMAMGATAKAEKYSVRRCSTLLTATKQYWYKWVGTLQVPEQYRDRIVRDAITLKLLTYSNTGAIIAAATTSIPEELGSVRCWDYRYCWVRDAALTADALKKIGRNYEPKQLMEFLLKVAFEKRGFQILYGIEGETRLQELSLDHLEGFRGAKPVRIGNAAYAQDQLDIYGYLIDIIYLYFVYYQIEQRMSAKYWRLLKLLVSAIKKNWRKKDAGIWEFRDLPAHYTHSKMMCLVGMSRAVRVAMHYKKDRLVTSWMKECDAIREELLKKGYNEKAKAFTISYGREELDASILLMAYYEVLPPDDPRLINTVRAINRKLRRKGFVKRYNIEDDFGKEKNAFTICSFWLVDALAYIGEHEKARELYNQVNRYANHLGLWSEDIDVKRRQLIGNFPQAYTHLAQMNSSIRLSEWGAKRRPLERRRGQWL